MAELITEAVSVVVTWMYWMCVCQSTVCNVEDRSRSTPARLYWNICCRASSLRACRVCHY